MIISMKDGIRKYGLILTLVFIFGLLFIQVRWIIHSIRFQEKVFQKTVTLALNQTISNLTSDKRVCSAMKQCILYDTIQIEEQLTSAGVWENIQEAIDEELNAYDINLKYNLYIVKKGTDSLKTKEKEIRKGIYYSQCLQDIIQSTDYELVVRFPGHSGFLLDKTGLMFVSSVVLILLIIISFGFIYRLYHKELRLAENTRELINNINHEFKTPLSSIALASNMIRKKRFDSDAKLQEYATLISRENKKLQHQVESLLHLTAIEQDGFEYNKEKTDIYPVIREALDTTRIFLQDKGGSLDTSFEASESVFWMDKHHMAGAILNLLSNAVTYSPDNPRIQIRTKNAKNRFILEVQDQGIGIPARYMKYIFQKYYRVPSGNIHNIKGFGIGLSYVKAVVEAHSGEVRVESVPGKGSTFILIFPITNG